MKKIKLNASLFVDDKRDCKNEEPVKFKIIANTGAPMPFPDGVYILDVNAVKPEKPSIPIVYNHCIEEGIGHSTEITVENNNLIVRGVVSRDTKYANDFAKSIALNYPWQASVGGYIVDSIDVKEGETLNYNGTKINGKCTLITDFTLEEVSVVEYGADSNTASKIDANKKVTNMEEKKPKQEDVAEKVDAKQLDDVAKAVKAQREAQAKELERISEIKKRSFGDDEQLQATAIKEGWTPDKFELEALRASRGKAPAIHVPESTRDPRAFEAAFVRACGFRPSEKRYTDKELSASDKIKFYDFVEFCEKAVDAPGYSFAKDSYRKICASLTTGGLGSLMTNAANAVLLQAFDYAENSYKQCFRIGSVSDYKQAERYRIDSNFKFKEVPEGAEIENADVSDQKFTIQAKTWGRKFSLTEQAIVNGDALGVFSDLLRQIAFGANEAINEQAWGMFMNPSATADSKAFYHADHGSLLTGKALTLENLSAARAAFISRKKTKTDNPLGVPPTVLAVPTSLEDKALMLTKATNFYAPGTDSVGSDFNPNAGRFKVVAVPFLGYATFTGSSETTWYLLSDPQRLAAFEIAFLNGTSAPIIRQEEMRIGTLGIEFDAHTAFGVAQEDYRGAMKITA